MATTSPYRVRVHKDGAGIMSTLTYALFEEADRAARAAHTGLLMDGATGLSWVQRRDGFAGWETLETYYA
jgi:hypothetical protein